MEIILLRLLIVSAMALVFGIQRQLSQKPVGFGTFVFVSVGSCVLTVISESLAPETPFIIVGGLITGIGFLGAGALIRTSDKIFGFTTAASIWVFSILGIVIGLGQYFAGIVTYLIIWAVVFIDVEFEKRGIGSHQRKVIISTNKILKDKETILKIFGDYKWRLIDINTHKEKNKSELTYLVTAPRNYVSELNDTLMKEKWVDSFKIE
ncbi:MAG: MgtC/SapB family protein [Candidatus Pacearchaeota archaeon]|jgi:putative Mg2+ transporter-C (MgtC) family protein